MFNKLKEQLKVMFEGNRCRFKKGCNLYKKNSVTCNNWYARFLGDKAYCGTYRKIERIDKRIEKIRSRIRAERKK